MNKCQFCSKDYDTKELKRTNGDVSWLHLFCSAQCYTKDAVDGYPKLEPMGNVRHLYLYAKGHYVREEIISDLRVIVGQITMIYPEHVDIDDILYWLTKEVYKYINNYDDFFSFISAHFPENRYLYDSPGEDNSYFIMIKKCLSILSLTSVDDIGYDIGVGDRKILPLISEVL